MSLDFLILIKLHSNKILNESIQMQSTPNEK